MSSSPQSHVDTTDIHDRTRRRPLALACAAALGMMAGVLLSPPVLAAVTTSQGGAGGNNGATHGGSGGAGNGSGGQGGDGDVGLPADGGDGGAGGHGSSAISAGGAGGSVGATTVGGSSVTGGNGVIGETDPALVYTSGGGGGGGAGVYTLDTSINLATGLTLTGGQGGDGGLNNPIAGGGGGGGAGLVVLSGTASINIDGNIVGGDGGDGASGQFSGGGGGGGDGIVLVGGAGVLTNTGSIVGGAGGQAGDATYYAGNHGGGGAGVNLGSDGNTVINSGTIVGGSAIGLPLSGGASGAGMIAGNGTQVTNQVGGSIIGGEASGTGSVGGHGIVATTSGAQSVIIDNHGSIVGGAGGRSLGGSAPSGTGGQAITASGNVSITNGGMIAGGHGGGIGGGRGGIGIDIVVADGEQATITNLGGAVIQGGYGGDLNSGNFGGAGIRADGNVTIVNQAGASILGDEGGLSDISTTGGTAIGADNGVSIDNSGLIAGTGGLGARSAINAHEASIVNRAGGSIIGGNGQGDSAGAVAISSSGGTRIDNAGSIVGGHVDNSGAQANAVLLAGGGNTLQLLAGSSITGNVLSISGSGAGGDSFILGGDVDAPGGNAFDVGGVSGFASYRKSGTSRWTLTGTGSTGQVWTIDAGSLVADALSLVTDVTDNATLVFDQAVDGIYAGIVSGSGNLVKQGTGALTLSDTSRYTGGTTITAGTLQIGNGGTTGSIIGNVANAGTLAFDRSDDVAFAGVVSGTGSLVQQGEGSLVLTGANSYTGGTTIADGTLQIGKGGTTGSIVGDVANDGVLVFDRSDDVAFAGKVSGSGSLVQQGEGSLVLTGANSYTGGTAITTGTLQVGKGGTTGSIVGDVANAGTLVFDRSNDVAFAGVVSGTGSLVQQGEGSLALTGDSNYTGGTTITDGTLQIGNGGTTGSIIGDVANAGTLAFDRSNDVAFAGVVAGSGSLVQQGAGTLTLTGANSYTGGTAITDGTLQIGNGGTTGSIVGDVANDGVLAFDRSDDVAFTGKVSGTGSLVQQGAGTLTLTGANSYTGGTMITAGTLTGDTASLQGDIANEAVLRFEQPADGRYAGVLSGGGVLDKRGAGTLALGGDSHAFAGSTRVRAGGLAVDGKLGGDLVMDAGTRLSGTGTLGNLDLAGTLAPGHSIGTLTASGDVVIHDGASYEVETDASGHSDQLAVAGRATLQGGSVLNLARDGAYATQTTYTILTADGGVSGTFGGVTSSLAFLDPTLIYDAHAVQLTLVRNQVDFCAVATTANQCATGQAIQNQGDGPLHEALVTQDAEHARAAMAQWSGESLASTRTALLRDSRFVRDAMSERLHRADSARDDARALGSSAGAIWAHGWEHTGRADGNGNASQARSSGHGLLLGVDAPLGDHLRAGITGGQGQDNTRVDALHDTARVKSRHLGLYAGSRWGAWQLDAGLAQSWHRIDSRRNIDAVLPATVHADYHGRSRQAQLEGSYRFALRRGSVQPFVNLAYVTAHTDALDEHGGVTALHSDSETSEAGFGTLGVRGLWTLAGTGTETSAIYGTLGWRHTFGDRVPLAQQHFADSERFTVSGAPLAANAAVLQLGIDAALSGRARLRAGYDGVLADDGKDHAVKLTLQVAL